MFNDHFEIYLADTPESKALHYNLRYKVYCEEMEFEDKNDFSTEQEVDKWDKNAVHFLLRYKNTGEWVGAVRLIFRNGLMLPLEELCSVEELENDRDFYNKNIAEVSRLCLVKEIRRRKMEKIHSFYGSTGNGDEEFKGTNVKMFYSQRQLRQSILFGLVHASAKYCVENSINDCFLLGTEALAKILRKSGLNISKVGDACLHRGERFPFKVNPAQTLSALGSDYTESFILCSELKITDSELLRAIA